MPIRDSIVSRCLLLQMESSETNSLNKVRRCLFGNPDHNQLKRDLQVQLENSSDFKQMWNFDPIEDQPVPHGRYEWKRVEDDEEIPSFYRKGYRPTKFRSRLNILDCNLSPPASPTSGVSRVSEVPDGTDTELEARELQRENETTPEVRTRQPLIDEYARVTKRRRNDGQSTSSDDDFRPTKSARLNVDV